MKFSKTKVFAAIFALLSALQAGGVIHLNPDILAYIQQALGAGMVWGVRDAIAKNGKEE